MPQYFKTIISPYTDGMNQTIVDVEAPFFDMFRQSLPDTYLNSESYLNIMQGLDQQVTRQYEQGRKIDMRESIMDIAQDFNKWKFEQTQEKNKYSEESLEKQNQMLNEIRELKEVSQTMLQELKDRPFSYRVSQ